MHHLAYISTAGNYKLFVWKCWGFRQHLVAQHESVMTDYNRMLLVVSLWSCYLFYDVMESFVYCKTVCYPYRRSGEIYLLLLAPPPDEVPVMS